MRRRWWLALAAALAGAAWFALLLPRGDAGERIGRFPRAGFLIEHDHFLSATDPLTVPAAEATFLRDEDEVFGVVVHGRARAYPITMMAYHHIVNDTIEGVHLAATY